MKKGLRFENFLTNCGCRLKVFAILDEFLSEERKKKEKIFNSKILTNSDCRLKIHAIFHEFSSEDRKKKKVFVPFPFSTADFWVMAQTLGVVHF